MAACGSKGRDRLRERVAEVEAGRKMALAREEEANRTCSSNTRILLKRATRAEALAGRLSDQIKAAQAGDDGDQRALAAVVKSHGGTEGCL